MIFMSLLLVAFLVPNQIQGCQQRQLERAVARGEVYGKKISTATEQRMRNELRSLAAIGINPRGSALDYCLLVEEAKHLGLRTGREDVIAWLRRNGVSDQALRNMQTRTRLSYNAIYDIIGRWISVSRLLTLQGTGVYESLPRLQLAHRNRTEKAEAQISSIDTAAFLNSIPEPTEAELTAFFDECKTRSPGHTAEELQFGYRLPDRVKIEYLTVDPEVVMKDIRLKSVQVKQHWEEYQQLYTKPGPVTTQPTPGPPPRIPMTFEEAEEAVRADLRQMRAVDIAAGLVNDMHNEASAPWAAIERKDGFLAQPEGNPVSFEALRDRYSSRYPVEHGVTEMLDAAALRALPKVGQAGIGDDRTSIRVTIPDLAFRVEGILEEAPDDGLPVLSLMEPADVMLTRKTFGPPGMPPQPYQAFLFRVIEVAPSAPPESMEGLREQVIKDWKLVRAHEKAGEAAEALAAKAREVGLKDAVEQDTELKAVLTAAEAKETAEESATPPTFLTDLQPATAKDMRRGSTYLRLEGDRGFVILPGVADAVFELNNQPTTESAPKRVVAQSVFDARTTKAQWVVAELINVQPLYEGPFEKQLAQAQPRRVTNELQTFFINWSDPEKLQRRTGFVAAENPDGREPEELPE
jgi:hypothetical protein